MSGLETLKGAVTQPVMLTEANVAFNDEELSDEAALSIVVADAQSAISYLQEKGLPTAWAEADDLYRGYVKPRNWPGTEVPRANLSMHFILEIVEKMIPEIYLAYFSDKDPFIIEAKGTTTPQAARARGKVLSWALTQAEFKEQIRRGIKQCFLYGYMAGKYGWEERTQTRKTYSRESPTTVVAGNSQINVETEESDKIKVTPVKVCINQPVWNSIDLRRVLLDPKLDEQDPRKGRFIIYQKFITADDLVDLAQLDIYKNVPTKEQLRIILAARAETTADSLRGIKDSTFRDLQAQSETSGTPADPLKLPLEILEWWSDDRVITVLQRCIPIRNEEHEFPVKPFNGCAFIDVPGSAYGFGIAKLLSGEQRFQTGVLNTWIDQLALVLNPTFQTTKGLSSGAQNIKLSPGRVITESAELKPLSIPTVSEEALNAISTSEDRANRRVGANGGSDMPTQALRTAQGVNAFQSDITNRLQYFIEQFSDLVFIPILNAFIEMCNDHLTPSQINQILSDADGKVYEGDIMEVYNATTSISVLTTTKLAAKKATANLIPMLIQLISSAPVQESLTQQGKKFNYTELMEEFLDLAGWDASLISDMTPDDLQRAQQMNPALQKAQADQAVEQAKQQGALQQIQEKTTGKAGIEVVKHILDQSKDSTALENILTQQQIQQPEQGS